MTLHTKLMGHTKVMGAALVVATLLAGCWGQTSAEAPIVPIRNMYRQPRYNSQARSAYFSDGRAMRHPPANTVAREMEVDPVMDTGMQDDGSWALTVPEPAVRAAGGMPALLERGEERYGIYCVPCHGGLGDGQGIVPNRSRVAVIRPPTFHDDRLRHAPDGQIYATIRNGIRNMPAYGHQIPVEDRWAIVAYVRALQLSNPESLADPEDVHIDAEAGKLITDSPVAFALASDRVDDASRALLDRVALFLRHHPEITVVEVIGHSNVPGDERVNQQIALRRSSAVVRYLRLKRVEQTFRQRGVGNRQPVCDEDSDDCRARNESVEFNITLTPQAGEG